MFFSDLTLRKYTFNSLKVDANNNCTENYYDVYTFIVNIFITHNVRMKATAVQLNSTTRIFP